MADSSEDLLAQAEQLRQQADELEAGESPSRAKLDAALTRLRAVTTKLQGGEEPTKRSNS